MSTQAEGGNAIRGERRRSVRLPIRVALLVCGETAPFHEETCTSSLNAHGALIVLETRVTVGQRLIIKNPENWAERSGRVIRLGQCHADRTEVGIEFTEPMPDFWLIPASSKGGHID
jgi:hypothetical protein